MSFHDLARLTDAVYQADLSKLRELQERERNIRAHLQDLDDQIREALESAVSQDPDWRAIGADQAWRTWLARRRSTVNMELARTLAQKSEALARVRRSFARNQVTGELSNQELAHSRARRARLSKENP